MVRYPDIGNFREEDPELRVESTMPDKPRLKELEAACHPQSGSRERRYSSALFTSMVPTRHWCHPL